MDLIRSLQKVDALEIDDVERRTKGTEGRWDATAHVRVGTTEMILLIEQKAYLDPRWLETFLGMMEVGRPDEGIPVIASEYVGPAIRRRLEEAGIGWLDDHGNLHVEGGGRLVHIERPLPRGAVPRPRGRLFSPSAGRVTQALLEAPGETRNLAHLAARAKVSVSSVSRALAGLEREGLVERGADGWLVPEPAALLDAWLDDRLQRDGPEARLFFSPDPPSVTLRQIVDASRDLGLSIILTGLSAAELIEPIVPAQRLDAYLFPPMKATELARHTGWIPTEEIPTVRLLLSSNEGPKVGASDTNGHTIVGRAQLVLDLMREGGRAKQVVQALRRAWGL